MITDVPEDAWATPKQCKQQYGRKAIFEIADHQIHIRSVLIFAIYLD